MSYFSKFPRTIITRNNQPFLIRDFLTRISITDDFRKNLILLEDYFVLDGETPELVSNKLYGQSTYHWIILIVNDIIDPREEWPVKNSKLIDRVYMNYDFIITVPSGAAYSINDELTSNNGGKFIVTNKSGNTIYIRSLTGFITLATTNTLNNITEETTGLVISSVTRPDTRIHHYYDTELQCIVDYDGSNPNIEPVTNFEHEMNINDEKRMIKVLNADVIPVFIKEFDNKLGV